MTPNRLFKSENYLTLKLFLILSILLFSTTLFAQSPTDFSGKWEFDVAKSDPGEGGSFLVTKKTLIITQDLDSISLNSIYTIPDVMDFDETDKYDLNSKEKITKDNSGITKTFIKWSEDKKSFILTTVMTVNYQGTS